MDFLKKLFGSKQPEPLDARAFTGRVLHKIRQTKPEIKALAKKELVVSYQDPSGNQQVANLHNSYQYYSTGVKGLEHAINDSVNGLLEVLSHVNHEQNDLNAIFPVIKPSSFTEAYLAQMLEQFPDQADKVDQSMVHVQPLAGDLVLTYVSDSEHGMAYLSADEIIKSFKLTPDKLLQQAIHNLRQLLKIHPLHVNKIRLNGQDTQLFNVQVEQNYETSLLVMPDDFWADIGKLLDGDIVAFVPARGYLLLAGSNDTDGLFDLTKLAIQIHTDQPHPISMHGYKRTTNGGWEQIPDHLTIAGPDGQPRRSITPLH